MIAVGGEACKEDSLCRIPLPAGRESGTVCEVNTERAAQRWAEATAEQSDVPHFSFSKGKNTMCNKSERMRRHESGFKEMCA